MKKYNSNRYFKLWFYSVSHSSLLIRSEIQFPDVQYSNQYIPNYTLDIEFWGVKYMDVLIDFEGLIISKEISKIPKKFLEMISIDGLKLYKIESINGVNYIVAEGCLVGRSIWTNEDRLHNPKLKYDEELFEL